MSNYFDNRGYMAPYGENGVLFTSINLRLNQKAGSNLHNVHQQALKCIDSVVVNNGISDAVLDEKKTWSHDNHTGLVCMSKNLDLNKHEKFFYKQWWRRAHPRDVVFYAWAMGGVSSIIFLPLLWISSLAMVWACVSDKDATTGDLDTDGKLLSWLRFNSFNMPITKLLCDLAIKRNKKAGSWRKVFEIYYGTDHPSCLMEDKVYEC